MLAVRNHTEAYPSAFLSYEFVYEIDDSYCLVTIRRIES